MGTSLSKPIATKYIERHGNKNFRIGVASMQGYRTSMEDAYTIRLSLPHHDGVGFIGVFDGHRGPAAAKFCSDFLHYRIDSIPPPPLFDMDTILKFNGQLPPIDSLPKKDPFTKERLEEVMASLDRDFMVDENRREIGSTAVFCIVNALQNQLTVANLGDSRCVVARRKAVQCTDTESHQSHCTCINDVSYEVGLQTIDHKPANTEEQKRIQEANSYVIENRVRGQLGLSRAIGDWNYKNNEALRYDQQQVICVPDVYKYGLQPDDIVVLCCDGVTETMSNEDIINFVAKRVWQMKGNGDFLDLGLIASELLDESLKDGSTDNLTALILMVQDGTDHHKEPELKLGPFYEYHTGNPSDDDFVSCYKENIKFWGKKWEDVLPALQAKKKRFTCSEDTTSEQTNEKVVESEEKQECDSSKAKKAKNAE